MKLVSRLLVALFLTWTPVSLADVIETTPYPYAKAPAPGVERGTYAFNGSGYAGPDCFFALIGAAKLLPNSQGTGGTLCAKSNIQFVGTGPFCTSEIATGAQKQLFVLSGPYTYNNDGTLCENLKIVGGAFDGRPLTFHDYVSPKGDILLTGASIEHPCPGIAQPQTGLAAGPANLFKISDVDDDPPGSGTLSCTNAWNSGVDS